MAKGSVPRAAELGCTALRSAHPSREAGDPAGDGQFLPGRWARRQAQLFALGFFSALVIAAPGQAADKIFFKQGSLVRSLPIQSLETFAAEGTVDSDLAFYFRVAGADQAAQEGFRQALQQTPEIDPNLVSQLLYSGVGEDLLVQFGELVQSRAGVNGGLALRAALVTAANSPEGLSLLNVLRQLPTDVQIDLDAVAELQQTVESIVQTTTDSVANLEQITAAEASRESAVDYATLPDLTQPGPYRVTQRQISLADVRRGNPAAGGRTLYVDLYQPQGRRSGLTPVIVFSHGLSAAPEGYRERLQHLASHGFLVAAPQHPGSDAAYVEDFRAGLTSEVFDLGEFIERPRDISAVIDELERRNQSEFGGQLNLQRVGVGGHSFGGYTALAVAGATIDFEHLQRECNQRFAFLNLSLLLQCQALDLPRQEYDFRDPRVGAVAVMNPVNSSIFGPVGLGQVQVPVAIAAGSLDPAAPAVFEQFRSFPWLQTPNRVLGLIEGQAHIVNPGELDAGIVDLINSIPGLALASPDLVNSYANAMSVAFYQTYVDRRTDYRLYLRASYAQYLSQGNPFRLYLVNAGSAAALAPLQAQPLLPQR